VGNWWENWIVCGLFVLFVFCCAGAVGAAPEWMVVRVVVRDRTEGAGDENVLSGPRPELTPHPTVAVVPSPDEAPCEAATSECAKSGSVDNVGAVDLLPVVGGGRPSWEDRTECLLRFKDELLIVFPVGPVENESRPFGGAEFPFKWPDWGYGLFCFDGDCFFEFDFIWYVFRFALAG
jgi:hypothetical protein